MAMTSSNLWTHALSKPYLLFLLTADVYMLTNGNDIIKFVDTRPLKASPAFPSHRRCVHADQWQ